MSWPADALRAEHRRVAPSDNQTSGESLGGMAVSLSRNVIVFYVQLDLKRLRMVPMGFLSASYVFHMGFLWASYVFPMRSHTLVIREPMETK